MDPSSYLSVLISIILALGMTRVLAGVGEMRMVSSILRHFFLLQTIIISFTIFHTLG
jgi:hypothetical protein